MPVQNQSKPLLERRMPKYPNTDSSQEQYRVETEGMGPPRKDTAVQVAGCRECLSLVLVPEDGAKKPPVV